MQTFTFRCSECQRRMAVDTIRMGKSVRCPHCRQVVVVPSNTAPPPVAAPPASPPLSRDQIPPASPANVELPAFGPPPNESLESIFAEGSDSDEGIFGTSDKSNPLFPALPIDPNGLVQAAKPSSQVDFNVVRKRPDSPALTDQPTVQLTKNLPSNRHEIHPTGREQVLDRSPSPTSAEEPRPPGGDSRAELPPLPTWDSLDDANGPQTARDRTKQLAQPSPAKPASPVPWWTIALIAYAVIMTILAAIGWLRS